MKRHTSRSIATRTGWPRRSRPSSSLTARSASSRERYSRILSTGSVCGFPRELSGSLPFTGSIAVDVSVGNTAGFASEVLQILIETESQDRVLMIPWRWNKKPGRAHWKALLRRRTYITEDKERRDAPASWCHERYRKRQVGSREDAWRARGDPSRKRHGGDEFPWRTRRRCY